ncbi:MAG: sulfur carrier protein ThiS [Acidobacteriota bacterium]|nr:sulfur carrier protein ThiS [Acidobacteriota bacterium]MDE3031786.1 sulfur carrier protein ThiS [Acidobacteriota bacterium]MDE3092216.1 sulfur carrier protein ThiS [Acidobacteriota bacterium]MDE3138472.1 sulfur carrier protein ThiS [Acidobacteriota bacterium]MDE3147439.1 sulfur carrier protein ThiS [Acidobacteriota bacterium]
MRVNGVVREFAAATSVSELLAALGIDPRGIAVAINGEVAPRSRWAQTYIATDDAVEIVSAVAGG